MANTARLVIDPVSRKISTKYDKIRLVQDDNNSTPVTFEMPRYVRGHDMSRCSTIEVHYDNISIDRKLKHSDVYVVKDIIVAPEDEETINFSWLVSRGATQIVGNVDFSLHFGCNEDPELEYAWHTTTYSGIVVLEGKNNTQSVVEKHPDLVASILEYVDKKISEFDAVDIAQETGDSTEAVMSQKATTEALGGKVDKKTGTGKFVYTAEDGAQTARKITSIPTAWCVPWFDGGGKLQTNDPVEDIDASNKKYVDDGLADKLDANKTQAYSVYCTGGAGAQVMRYLSPIGTATNSIPYYSPPTNATQFPEDANPTHTFGVCDPVRGYHPANKQWTEKNFVPIHTQYANKLYGTGGATGNVTQRFYSMSSIGSTTGDVVNFLAAANVSFDNKEPTCTIGVCDPIKPIQVVNLRTLDRVKRDLQQGVYNALGYQYVTVEDTSTSDFSSIPEGAMPFAYFESLGDIVVYGHDGKVIANTAEVTGIAILGEGGLEESLDPNSVPTFFEIPNGCTTIMLSLSIPEAASGLMDHFEIKGKKIIYQVKVGA